VLNVSKCRIYDAHNAVPALRARNDSNKHSIADLFRQYDLISKTPHLHDFSTKTAKI
jgi:hypothetical protein